MSDVVNPDWQLIKADYVTGKLKIIEICELHNISKTALMQHRTLGNWPGRYRSRVPSRKALIARMFVVLEKQIEKMEDTILHGSDDKEIALLGNLVRTLEKLVELDTKQKSCGEGGTKSTEKSDKDMNALRKKIGLRIEQLATH